jgi:DNA topoisomerase VI subunit A
MTGKGYPDVNSRRLLRMLSDAMRISVLYLGDCDPHGFEIGNYGVVSL